AISLVLVPTLTIICLFTILFCVVCLDYLPPPFSPFFPYTTLFRSGFPYPAVSDVVVAAVAVQAAKILTPAFLHRFGIGKEIFVEIGRAHVCSSHVSISYAVFCLKKKKIPT